MDLATIVPLAVAAVLVVVAATVAVAAMGLRRRTERELSAARAEVGALRGRVEDLDGRMRALASVAGHPVATDPEFVITSMSAADTSRAVEAVSDEGEPGPVRAGDFASVAARESLVRLLCLGYGVRRALSAGNRNRMRFEMRQEVKLARRRRRQDLKAARRHLRAAGAGGERVGLTTDAA
jgi:hypothetical protein